MKYIQNLLSRLQFFLARQGQRCSDEVSLLSTLLRQYPRTFEIVSNQRFPSSVFIVPTDDDDNYLPVICLEPTEISLISMDAGHIELNLLERFILTAAIRDFNNAYHAKAKE